MTHFNRLIKYCLAGTLASLIPSRTHSDDIFKGVKGPTNWQLDERINYKENENKVKTLSNNLILKYWDGEKIGKWGFLHLPYAFITNEKETNQGLGDISLGGGPRFTAYNFHFFPTASLKLPTGDFTDKIPLGDGRYDTKLSLFTTYLTQNKKFHIDSALEYNLTGENKKNINPPNEIYGALLVGGEVIPNVRLATGFTHLMKENGDYLFNMRSILRYTFSPSFHLELVGDVGIESRNISEGFSLGLFLRYNF